jgi:hypothetical protein
MMEFYKGYWITGSAIPRPPYTHYWHPFGKILKDGRLGQWWKSYGFKTVVSGSTTTCVDMRGLAEFFGLEISRIAVDHCSSQP